MNKTEIKEKLKTVFLENGLDIPENEEDTILELDSLQFIALVVGVENAFDIQIPDDYLSNEVLSSFGDFCELLILLMI